MSERFKELNKYRLKNGAFASKDDDPFGVFFIKLDLSKPPLKVICSPFEKDYEWEHVSVSLPNRCPTWEEMCFIKSKFWGDDETVIQFHPPKSEYVNNHPYCLHLWRNTRTPIATPPSILVGLK